ncbi:hypothetical protein ABZ799_26880 [Nocardiopsis dassonvillei]|uniref:hypothetical protein n=1 Tax=Nocardiopsis dassonvillei TaxID=2014 RepID=UPI0034073BC5
MAPHTGRRQRPPTRHRVTDTYVQLQSKVPPEIREAWKDAAAENDRNLSMLFEALVREAEARGQSLGALLRPLLSAEKQRSVEP